MFVRFVAATVVAVGLSGCVSGQHEAANTAVRAGYDECRAKTFKKRVELSRCFSEVDERVDIPTSPFPDLVRLKNASRIALAARFDRGEISDEDGRLEFARTVASLESEAQRRSNNGRAVAAQETAARAALFNSGPTTCVGGSGIATCF